MIQNSSRDFFSIEFHVQGCSVTDPTSIKEVWPWTKRIISHFIRATGFPEASDPPKRIRRRNRLKRDRRRVRKPLLRRSFKASRWGPSCSFRWESGAGCESTSWRRQLRCRRRRLDRRPQKGNKRAQLNESLCELLPSSGHGSRKCQGSMSWSQRRQVRPRRSYRRYPVETAITSQIPRVGRDLRNDLCKGDLCKGTA